MIAKALLVAALFAAPALALAEVNYEAEFQAWKTQFSRSYPTQDEEVLRFAIFRANLDRIRAHNAKGASWTMAMNAFGDLTQREFAQGRIGGVQPPALRRGIPSLSSRPTVDLPPSVDWVARGDVTPVKNQGECGACWAFTTAEAIESINAINGHGLIALSEQQLIDCAGGGSACSGGEMPFDQSFQWVIDNGGLCSEAAYPFAGDDGTCQKTCVPVAKIRAYANVKAKDDLAFATALAQQPIAVSIEADQPSFQFYSGGILTGDCGTQLDHDVLAVGYGTQGGVEYYKLKNSWGASWGMAGYILVGRGEKYNGGAGQCGIYTMPAYPIQ